MTYCLKLEDIEYTVKHDCLIINKVKVNKSDIFIPASFEVNNEVLEVHCIDAGAFVGINLQKINIPKFVTEIKQKTFYKQNLLKEVQIDGEIMCIEAFAFAHCVSLQSINLENVRKMAKDSFYSCQNLQKIVINNCELYNTFNNCKIKDITLMGKCFFESCFTNCHIENIIMKGTLKFDSGFCLTMVNSLIFTENLNITFENDMFVMGMFTLYDFSNNLYSKYYTFPESVHKTFIKKDYETLINNGYNDNQVNQILMGYNDYFILNFLPTNTDVDIFRTIRTMFKKSPECVRTALHYTTKPEEFVEKTLPTLTKQISSIK